MFNLVDAHCDTIVRMMDEGTELFENTGHLCIKKLMKYESPVQIFAICAANKKIKDYYGWYRSHVDLYYAQVEKNKAYIGHANTYAEIIKNISNKKMTGLLSIEGAEVLGDCIEKLHEAAELGVRNINITWNNNNAFGYSCHDNENRGLTELGKIMVKDMNKLGMMIDVSHLSEKGFWDVYEKSEKPFIASHSNAHKLSPVARNLTDDQLKALGEAGGAAGLNLCASFLSMDGKATMQHCIRHLERMLNIAGEDCVGLGCDYDGISDPEFELTDISKLDILHELCKKEFGSVVTEKIFYKNFMRVMKEVLPA